MALLTYEQTLKCVLLTLNSERVPLIMGERGIGKTSLVWDVAEILNANLVTIDANLLKEGEIGGLPTTSTKKFVNEKGETYSLKIAEYATHVKIQYLLDFYEENPKKTTILFIDELNRTEHAVIQELMNIILNREINGVEIPPNVKIIAACNPSSEWSDFKDSEYHVTDIDEAQKDRFRWLPMGCDLESWIKWAIATNDEGVSNIEPIFYEYLSDREGSLNVVKKQDVAASDDVNPSPRSWEAASNTYRDYLRLLETTEDDNPYQTLYECLKGDLGITVATDLLSFIKNNKNPLIKPHELFENPEALKTGLIPEGIALKIKGETIIRKNILTSNMWKYLWRKVENKEDYGKKTKLRVQFKLFMDLLLTLIPRDMFAVYLKEITNFEGENVKINYLNDIFLPIDSEYYPKERKLLNTFTKLNSR